MTRRPDRLKAGIGFARYVPDYLKIDSTPYEVAQAFVRVGDKKYPEVLAEYLRGRGEYDARILYNLMKSDINGNNTVLFSAFLISLTLLGTIFKSFSKINSSSYATQAPTQTIAVTTPTSEVIYTPLPPPSPTEEPLFVFDGPAIIYIGFDTITPYPNYFIFFGGPFDLRAINVKVPKYGRNYSEINEFLDGKVSRRGEKVDIYVEAQRKRAEHIIGVDIRYYDVHALMVDGVEIPTDTVYYLKKGGFSGGLDRGECNERMMWVSEYPAGRFGVESDDNRLYSNEYRKRLVSLSSYVRIQLDSDTERDEIVLNENQVEKCED